MVSSSPDESVFHFTKFHDRHKNQYHNNSRITTSSVTTRQGTNMAHDHWSYFDDDAYGPNQWDKLYPTGKHQSPINILVNDYSLFNATCCRHSEQDIHELTDKLNSSLNISKPISAKFAGRKHLDSIGEDLRSGSSSVASSPSRSPIQNDHSDQTFCDYDNITTLAKCKTRKFQDVEETQNTRFCLSNKKIFLGYPRHLNTVELSNTGHTWQVTLPREISTHSVISGPPFGDKEYRLAQFHCHWGEDCDHGSEHQINGKSFAAEIHFVHWNCTDFESFEEASKYKHGLVVLGVLVQALEGEQNRNRHLQKIITGLDKIRKAGSSTLVRAKLDIKKLFPANRWVYATYEGSLTTPPLAEVVDWVVFLNPIQCSSAQIEQFRNIQCPPSRGSQSSNNHERLMKNCRPIQPTNNRLISVWTHH